MASALAVFSCQSGDADVAGDDVGKDGRAMRFDPQDFHNAEWNTYDPGPCSPPEQSPNWRGVVIRAPQAVYYESAEALALPVCGHYMADLSTLPSDAVLTLVAVNVQTGDRFSGPVVEYDPSPEAPPPDEKPLAPEDLEGLASGGYFNVNLFDFVKLPPAPGTYDVQALYGHLESNRIRVQLQPQ